MSRVVSRFKKLKKLYYSFAGVNCEMDFRQTIKMLNNFCLEYSFVIVFYISKVQYMFKIRLPDKQIDR